MIEGISRAIEWLKNKFKKKSNVTTTIVIKNSVIVVAFKKTNR